MILRMYAHYKVLIVKNFNNRLIIVLIFIEMKILKNVCQTAHQILKEQYHIINNNNLVINYV